MKAGLGVPIAAIAAMAAGAVPAKAEPASDALYEARTHFEDPDINAVTFRATDAFFPVERIEPGNPLPLPRRERPIAPEVEMDGTALAFEEALLRTQTNALLVMRDGAIVDERYFNGSDENSRFISWSVAKSVVSILVGIAIDQGLIASVEDPIDLYVTDLEGTAYEGVTIEQMLMMRAGTDYAERSYHGEPTPLSRNRDKAVYRNEGRMSDIAWLGIGRRRAPGTAFNYSTLTSTLLGKLVETVSGMSLADYTERYLWKPAGMEAEAYWLLDGPLPDGRAYGGGGFNATLRDYGRLGQLMLDYGKARNGTQVVSREWVERSTRRGGEEKILPDEPRGYRYQWWTTVGTEIFEAIGIHGQYVSVDPTTDTVIVKLSYWPDRGGLHYEMDNFALLDAVRERAAHE